MIVQQSQRWRDGRVRMVGPAGPFDPAPLAVRVLEEREARPFVLDHHYSGTFPAARLSVGLLRNSHLVGVAIFSVPMNNRAVPFWTGLEQPNAGAELGRLVLLDDVPDNAESWFMARAFTALRQTKPEIEAVLSYSDPVARLGAGGELVKPGHVGKVYQALSAVYRGLSGQRTSYWTPAGEHVSGRALSKIRLGERGADYAAETLLLAGAHARQPFEPGAEWLARLSAEGWLRRSRHPGNHAYVFPLTKRAKGRARRFKRLDYPQVDA